MDEVDDVKELMVRLVNISKEEFFARESFVGITMIGKKDESHFPRREVAASALR